MFYESFSATANTSRHDGSQFPATMHDNDNAGDNQCDGYGFEHGFNGSDNVECQNGEYNNQHHEPDQSAHDSGCQDYGEEAGYDSNESASQSPNCGSYKSSN